MFINNFAAYRNVTKIPGFESNYKSIVAKKTAVDLVELPPFML
jgi:hypothetical protein